MALQGLADRTGLVSLARFVDGIVVAVEGGTPLADVLRSQAQDVREAGRRAVMEEGGKKEIAMMVPTKFNLGHTWARTMESPRSVPSRRGPRPPSVARPRR